jgi:hypothetical protein
MREVEKLNFTKLLARLQQYRQSALAVVLQFEHRLKCSTQRHIREHLLLCYIRDGQKTQHYVCITEFPMNRVEPAQEGLQILSVAM